MTLMKKFKNRKAVDKYFNALGRLAFELKNDDELKKISTHENLATLITIEDIAEFKEKVNEFRLEYLITYGSNN